MAQEASGMSQEASGLAGAEAAADSMLVRKGRALLEQTELESRILVPGIWRAIAGWIALGFAVFHLYTAFFGVLVGIQQRIVHIGFALVLTFLLRRVSGRGDTAPTVIDLLWAVGVCLASLYLANEGNELDARLGIVLQQDIVLGAILTLALLEATRRLIGISLPLIAGISILYAYFGPYMPGILAHRGFGVEDITTTLFLSTEGVYGIPTAVSATYVVLFIILGATLKHSGAVSFFTDLSVRLFGKVRGGPAKVAVVASGMFGMISGSAIANVASTGVITIPLMKKIGFSARFAAAVEAVASSCGQFTPPIMASAAFVIAEILGIGYLDVALGALIPATLYYAALFVAIDLRAARMGMRPGTEQSGKTLKRIMISGGYVLLVPVTLVVMLAVFKYSPLKAGIYTIIVNVLLFLIKEMLVSRDISRLGVAAIAIGIHALTYAVSGTLGHWPAVAFYALSLAGLAWLTRYPRYLSVAFLGQFVRRIVEALKEGGLGTLEVAACVGCAGIIIGMFMLTGLGLRLSSMLIDLAGGNLLLLLVLTMVASLILGMGVPTLGAYIVLAILVAPGLITMGVQPLAAHLFIFYFGVISSITPPVALASFTAAVIAGSDPMRTGMTAFRLGITVFIIPFMMVYQPEMIMQGEWYRIVLVFCTSLVGASALAAGLEGYWFTEMTWWERLILVVAGVLLVEGQIVTDFIGAALIGVVFITQRLRAKRGRAAGAPDATQLGQIAGTDRA